MSSADTEYRSEKPYICPQCSQEHTPTIPTELFIGLSTWPELVDGRLLAKPTADQHDAGEAAASSRDESAGQALSLDEIVSQRHRFLTRDIEGRSIAARFVGQLPGDSENWTASGFSTNGDVRLLDLACRGRRLKRLWRRLQEATDGPKDLYWKMDRTLLRLEYLDQGLAALPYIAAMSAEEQSQELHLKVAGFATLLWGTDREEWPPAWEAELFASIAALQDVRSWMISTPKSGWRPRVMRVAPVVSAVQIDSPDQFYVRVAEGIHMQLLHLAACPTHFLPKVNETEN